MYENYETIIGLEVHVQLQTQSKLFAPDSAKFGAEPNRNTSFITAGHPGTLPYINETAVEYAVKMGLALNCPIRQDNYFDRKNYFYPDLPKGYQVTQDNAPICGPGFLEIEVEGKKKKIRIHHIHMEEDAGKSIHDQDSRYSLIDLNRAGVPLIEIVTEPDMRSAEETAAFLNEIRKIIQYLGVSDGNMEEGSLRCDCNISVRPKGQEAYNNRAEIKNMNSVKFVRKAIDYEFKRQVQMMEKGETVVQQTRGFDSQKGITIGQRDKEMAHDYRYFPEPDLPALHLSDDYLNKLKAQMPELPSTKRARYQSELGLSAYDAGVLCEEKEIADYFEKLLKFTQKPKTAANWMNNSVKSFLNEKGMEMRDFPLVAEKLGAVIALVDSGKINHQSASLKLFPALVENLDKTAEELAEEMNLLVAEDGNFLEEVIQKVMDAHPKELKDYRNGKKKLFGMFMGQVMREAGGKLNPQEAKALLTEKLSG